MAFVVDIFPVVSETFIIDQIAALLDRGVQVEIFSLSRGDEAFVSRKYFDYDMGSRVRYLDYPLGWLARFARAWPKACRLLARHPRTLVRALNAFRYGTSALSLQLLYLAQPLAGRDFDVVHCHFGHVGRAFVPIREIVGMRADMVTTFYGVDVSRAFRDRPADYYDELKNACSLYFVMSEDMKRRVVAHGFPTEHVRVLPVSVDVDSYPFRRRTLGEGEELRLAAVGRFVEKKGFDDLLRALAIVKERARRPVSCVIVGDGPLDRELRAMATALGLDDTVRFTGFMAMEDIIGLFEETHVLVQPSKTASDGDME